MNGEKVGDWSIDAAGRHAFGYDSAWLGSRYVRPISLCLPLRPADAPYLGPRVEAFFDNLLPDSPSIRKRFQSRFGLPTPHAFDLLSELGRDCVGALQILPADSVPGKGGTIQGDPLDEAGVAAALRAAVSAPLPGRIEEDAFRISLAGAQEKTAFLWHKGKWHRPKGTTPTTHIFKLPMGDGIGKERIDLSSSVEIEWLCGRIARAFGLPVAAGEIRRFEDQKVLVVERFDRVLSGNGKWWVRLPQEDLCQAMGVALGRKYEADGAPGMGEILSFLLGSRDALADRRTFLKSQVLFWLLAAVDGHARNFSIFLGRQGAYHLTPLYDIISLYPVMGHGRNRIAPEKAKMAMSVRGRGKHYHWDRITVRHWRESAAAWGMGSEIGSIMTELIDQSGDIISGLAAGLPPGFPGAVAEPVLKCLRKAVSRLEQERIG